MAHLLCASNRRSDFPFDVDRHCVRALAVPGDGSLLCRNGKTVSRHGKFLLFRRAVLSEPRQGLALCPPLEIHRWLGIAPLLLDLSGRDGRGHRNLRRLRGRNPLSELHERFQSGTCFYDAGCHLVHLWRGLHRSSRSEWFHGSEHRHQCDSDFSIDRLLGNGHRVSHEPRSR